MPGSERRVAAIRTACLVAVTLFLNACSGLGAGYEKPTVTVSDFRTLPSDGIMPSFEIDLRVINPNREALNLVGMSYTISLDGHQLIKGVGNNLPTVEAYGEGTFTVTAAASMMAGVRLLNDLMNKPSDTFEYRFDAKLDVGRFNRAIRVKESGNISLGSARSQ
ncbi:MAG: LEA type 2 family protein [Woeseia sp.]|nr:LEA type 2 family protein [Woeseia sp.]